MTVGDPRPDLSLVIPVHNEAGNIGPLLSEIEAAFLGRSYEIVLVDDGSDEATRQEIAAAPTPARVLTHARRSGKSRALMTGFAAARGAWVLTLDGDGQNDPRDLAALSAAHVDGPRDVLVAGVRNRRNDGVVKLVTSRIANFLRKRLLRDDCRDAGCGVKMMPTAVARALPYFDNMHRFLPALARREELRVVEVLISDRPRQHGRSKYGFFDRASVALLDLIGVYWLTRRRSDPGAVEEQTVGEAVGADAPRNVVPEDPAPPTVMDARASGS